MAKHKLEWKIKKWLQQGKVCPECNEPLMEPYTIHGGRQPDDFPTVEHVISRLNPLRAKVEGTLQILHYKCNQARNNRELASLPLDELHQRSGRYGKVKEDLTT